MRKVNPVGGADPPLGGNAFGAFGLDDTAGDAAPGETQRRAIGHFGQRLDRLRSQQQARWAGRSRNLDMSIAWSGTLPPLSCGDVAFGAFGEVAFEGDGDRDGVWAQAVGEAVDELGQAFVLIGIFGDPAAERNLLWPKRGDLIGMQGQIFDAEACIDGLQTFGEQALDMLPITGWLTGTDPKASHVAIDPVGQKRQPLGTLACLVQRPAKIGREMRKRMNQGRQLDDRFQKSLFGAIDR